MGSSKSGTTTPTPKRCAISMRTARATPPESMALATMPPRVQAATLSGWPSRRAASSSMRAGFQPRSSRQSATTTPAVRAAALEPIPFPSGIWFEISSSMGGMRRPRLSATATAVCQIRLSGPAGIEAASRPLARISSAVLRRKRQVRYTPKAIPRASKPGPRLALEAGTRTVYQVIIADEPNERPAVIGSRGFPFP